MEIKQAVRHRDGSYTLRGSYCRYINDDIMDDYGADVCYGIERDIESAVSDASYGAYATVEDAFAARILLERQCRDEMRNPSLDQRSAAWLATKGPEWIEAQVDKHQARIDLLGAALKTYLYYFDGSQAA